jgi:hypothetical protein
MPAGDKGDKPMLGNRWEYSPLASAGDNIWRFAVDPLLRLFATDLLTAMQRLRAAIQIVLTVALALIPVSIFYKTGHTLTASGLLFDIAGALRLFLLEENTQALSGFAENEHGNLPSVAMRELVMPEAGPFYEERVGNEMSNFYYRKRGVLFLFIGFVLQMIADLVG